MSVRTRLTRLEASQRRQRPHEHFINVVRVPWDELDEARWLRELPCACGAVGCPQRRIGLREPEKAPSAEAWAERWQVWQQTRDGGDAS